MKFLKKIHTKPLFKLLTLNSLSVFIKICIGFIVSKFIAVFVGPQGLAFVGNLRNFLSSVEAVATLGFENGVVKYVSEHKKEKEKLDKTIATVFITVGISCIAISLFLFLFPNYLNSILFPRHDYSFIFRVLAITLPFYIGNILITATLNGLGKFNKVIYVNIIGAVFGLFISIVLMWQMKTQGALLALVISPAVILLVSLFYINKEIPLFKAIQFNLFDVSVLKNLSSYSLMVLVSSVIGSIVSLAIRKNIIATIGLEQAGYWEAMTRISSYYLLFITTILSLYYLPKMAETKNNQETKKLFWGYYKQIMPLFIFGLLVLYFLKDYVIHILFTKEFLPISKLFFWQLVGDVLKAASFVLAFQFYAKKLTKAFVIFELFSLTVLYSSNLYFVAVYKLEGAVMAHAFTYVIYLLSLSIYFRKSLF